MDTRSPNSSIAKFLSPGLLAIFGSAYLPVAALQIPLVVYLPNYYASHIGLPLAYVGVAFFVVRLIDVFFDPLIGIAINHTQTSVGRFRPWMIGGVPLVMFASFAVFMAVPGATTIYLIASLLVLYLGYSVLTLGHGSWAAALAPQYHQRSLIYGWVQAIGVIGTVTVLAIPPLVKAVWHTSNNAPGVQAMGWFIIAITPLSIALCTLFIREPKRSDTRDAITLRDYWIMFARPSLLRVLAADLALALGPAITAALYLFFFTQVLRYSRTQTDLLLLLYILAGLAGAPFWAQVAKGRGKHRTVMLACLLYGVAQALAFMLPKATLVLMIPAMFFAGFVVSAFTFLIRAMIADVADEVRLDIRSDRTALLFGLVTSTSKVGGTLAVIVTFPLLGLFGFNAKEGALNTPIALDALTACYIFVPVLTMFVGAAMLRGYKLDAKRHDAIRAQLGERDLALAGAEGVIEGMAGVTALPIFAAAEAVSSDATPRALGASD